MTGSRDGDRRQTTYLLIAVLAAAGYPWVSPLSPRRWLDRPSAGTAGAYVVLAALTVYAHYLFGIMLAVHVVYVIARRQQDGTPPWGRIGIVLAAIGVLLLPLGPPLLSLVRRRASLSWADEPSLADVLGVVALPLALAVPAWRESRGRRTSVD